MLLELKNVNFSYAGDPVLSDVSFTLHEGERAGLIGGNGEGKTTLIKLMLGLLAPDGGEVTRKNSVRIGYLEQSGGLESDKAVYAAMEEVFAEDRELISRLRETENEMATADENTLRIHSARCESLTRRIAARDSYHYDVRIRTVLCGMGFEKNFSQIVSTMSGGEKTRLKLCKLLLEEPDLLVLDEPTNHLDISTLFWLEEYLASFKGALFIVSHDRYFLDRLTSRTLEIERGRLYTYKGNYTKYRVLKEKRVKELRRAYEKQQEEVARLTDYVNRNIVRATTAKSALSRVNKLERMELLEKPLPPPEPPRFRFLYDERPYERVIFADRFDLAAGGKTLLTNASFTLMRGERCAIVGDNGTGKSTLLKFLLSGSDRVNLGRFVRIAYYDQENADLDPEERMLDAFWGKNMRLSQTEARAVLARAGLEAEDIDKKVKELSGGMRAKLELALLEARRGNTLLLDEPTNHLDLPAREALEDALKQFDGTLLFVSHDRRFIEALADKILLIENGELKEFKGSYTAFLEARKAVPSEPVERREKKPIEGYRSKEERAREAQKRQRIQEVERQLMALEREEEELNAALIEHAADYQKVQEISKKLDMVRLKSDALYEEYDKLI